MWGRRMGVHQGQGRRGRKEIRASRRQTTFAEGRERKVESARGAASVGEGLARKGEAWSDDETVCAERRGGALSLPFAFAVRP